MSEEFPLAYSGKRHALLHQIHALASTDGPWTRERNPKKKDPASGLPDHLYTVQNPDRKPDSTLQRGARELDKAGLLSAAPGSGELAGLEVLDLSPLGAQALESWTAKSGAPGKL